jgi:group I intron endonuclease
MVIYKTTNLLNGKWYIGKDSKGYPGYLGSGIHLKAAIEKYGKENFSKEVLQECSTMDELNNAEIEWIEKTNAVNDPQSYNLAQGGQGGDLSEFMNFEKKKGRNIHSDEERKKRSENWKGDKNPQYGKTLSEEHKQKMINANRNRDYFFSDDHREKLRQAQIGKKLSDETKRKMSESRKGKKRGPYKTKVN